MLLLVLAQLFLPAHRREPDPSRVGRYGKVQSVSVSAWPAIELLWGDADSVHVSAGSLALSPGADGDAAARSAGASRASP